MTNPNDPYADAMVDPYEAAAVGQIPKTENLLQRAMKIAQGGSQGFFDTYTLGGTALARNAGDFVGEKIMGPLPPKAEEEYKEMNSVDPTAYGVGAAVNVGKGIYDLGKLGVKGINALRTSPIKKKIKGIEELIGKSKQSEIPIQEQLGSISQQGKILKESASKAAEKTAYEGSKAVKEQISGRFRDANKRFGEVFSKLESQMGDEDLAKVINRAANDVGDVGVPGSPGNTLSSLSKKFGPQIKEGVIQTQPRIYNKEQVQSVTKEILDALPDERSKAIFHKHLIDALPDSVKGLKELKASHAPIYKVAKESKLLTKGALKRVARGTASDPEIEDLSRVGERLGTSHVERAKTIAKRNKLQQYALEQRRLGTEKRLSAKGQEQEFLKSKIPGLEREIGDVRFRRAVTLAVGGLLGGGGLLSKIFNVENLSN